MIKKITKFAALLLTVAVARTTVIPEEFAPPTTPKIKASIQGSAVDWTLFSVGALLGSAIETGTNIGLMPNKYIRCVA